MQSLVDNVKIRFSALRILWTEQYVILLPYSVLNYNNLVTTSLCNLNAFFVLVCISMNLWCLCYIPFYQKQNLHQILWKLYDPERDGAEKSSKSVAVSDVIS